MGILSKRIPTFETLVDEPLRPRPLFDAGYDPHRGKDRHDGRAAVAEKRQRQPDDRHKEQAHADVGNGLEDEHARHADAHKAFHAARRFARDNEAADDDGKQQHDDEKAPDKTQFLAADAEDEVCLPLGQARFIG